MKTQLLLVTTWILTLLVLNSDAAVNRTKCTDNDKVNTVKQEIQRFYCTVVKIYDDIQTVRI